MKRTYKQVAEDLNSDVFRQPTRYFYNSKTKKYLQVENPHLIDLLLDNTSVVEHTEEEYYMALSPSC